MTDSPHLVAECWSDLCSSDALAWWGPVSGFETDLDVAERRIRFGGQEQASSRAGGKPAAKQRPRNVEFLNHGSEPTS
ncbi:MAG: hypothetical protein HKM89_03565 [Gemmatimonadales bacterium]|nr:hypothetical protein [Gemmatimonadales bacterium]